MDENIYGNYEEFSLREISSAPPGAQVAMWTKDRYPESGPPPPSRPPPPLQSSGAADRCCRWTAVGLGILCALLLGLSIGLAVWLLTERDQLLTNQNNLLTNHSNLLKERDQLLQYKRCYDGLGQSCPTGWDVFKCNCYHNTRHGISWSASRKYCQSLGGDLVVINSPEEQWFITAKKYGGWIGLTKRESGSWRWIDNTTISTWYWNPTRRDSAATGCAAIHQSTTTNNTWCYYTCASSQHWSICEKSAFATALH